jgi:hypothetical protein
VKIASQWKPVILFGLGLLTTALLAATQCSILGIDGWTRPEIYWATFLSFLFPVLLAFGLIAWTNRIFLPGEQGGAGRKLAWLALALRLLFLVVVPLAMMSWGYASDVNRSGMVELDSTNAAHTAWLRSTENSSALTAWKVGEGDNTGGLSVLGVLMFRLFSPDLERTLLLGILAAAVSSLTVVVVYRLADLLFTRKIARLAAFLVAVYPEAILLGTGHQQQAYLALFLGVGFLAIAALMTNRPSEELLFPRPSRRTAWLLLAGSILLSFFLSSSNFLPACLVWLCMVLWMSDLRSRVGKVFWIGSAAVLAVLLVLRVLGALDVILRRWDPLLQGYQYFNSYAWLEFEKMSAAGGGDFFQKIILSMDRSTGFVVAAFYGLLQPILPAAIGHRLDINTGFFWSLLGIWRGLGWFTVLPVAIYATGKAVGGLLRRPMAGLMAIVFWAVAWISSYRALGDLWDNPRYRLFALIPFALLAAWGWVQAEETSDTWLARIAIPFTVLTVSLTVWYFIRESVPMIPALGVILGLTAGAFLLACIFLRRKERPPVG